VQKRLGVGTKPEKNSGAVMGLLNSNTLNDYVTQTIPNNARNIWDAILRSPEDLKKIFANPNGAKDVMAAVEKQKQIPVNPQTFIDQGMNLAGMAPVGGLLGQTVYHGSPHLFDKFDISKIGTGEGAQAYGHGLYFAESPGVAKSYAGVIDSKTLIANLNPDEIAKNYGMTKQHAEKIIDNWRNTPFYADEGGNATDEFFGKLKSLNNNQIKETAKANYQKYGYSTPDDFTGAINKFINADTMTNMINESARPAFYKVDIPDEAIPRMLDWDKPLSEQHPDVRAALNKIASESPDSLSKKALTSESTYGDDLHKALTWLGDNSSLASDRVNAANLLKQQGIPGIRYLDGTSRTAGQGTSNYVLFDDQLPRILEVNGKPTGLLSYADEAKNAKQAWAKTDVFGSGSRIDHISPDGKSAVVQQRMRSGTYRYYPANVNEKFGVMPEMEKGFDSLEDAKNSIKGMRISATKKSNNQEKYGEIPNLWGGDAKKIAKALIDNDIPITRFSSSTQSKSKYIELADGRKIRLSDHDLPLSYEGSDIEFRYGNDIKSIIDKINNK
jgi:hypothetical protein